MRIAPFVTCTLAAFAMAAVPAAQDKEDHRPKKGDTIVVEGCLRGGTIEATRTSKSDGTATVLDALIYRLTGDKKALKAMRKEHEGTVVEVTGQLKSMLPAGDGRGTQIGRTGIYIGVGDPRTGVGSPMHSEMNRAIPVLELKSYEGRSVKCD
jgi:hypothetical protein